MKDYIRLEDIDFENVSFGATPGPDGDVFVWFPLRHTVQLSFSVCHGRCQGADAMILVIYSNGVCTLDSILAPVLSDYSDDLAVYEGREDPWYDGFDDDYDPSWVKFAPGVTETLLRYAAENV